MNNRFKTILIISTLVFFLSIILWGLGDALSPLLVAFALTYLLFPIIKKLEAKGIKRNYSIAAVFVSTLALMGLFLALVIPNLVSDGREFLKELPSNSSRALNKLQLFISKYDDKTLIDLHSIQSYASDNLTHFSGGVLKSLSKGLRTSFSGVSKIILSLLNLFLIPLFFFYVAADFEKISNEIKSFIPIALRPKLKDYSQAINNILSGYIRGQLLVAVSLGLLYSIGLILVGLRFGVLIGLLSGAISIIPYAGVSIGLACSLVVALANDTGPQTIIGVLSVFALVQVLEGTIITPKLVGDKVGLGSLSTMLALIIGGNLLGLKGMLLAIPIAAIGKIILSDLKKQYLSLKIFKA